MEARLRHRSRPHGDLAERGDREFEGKAAGIQHAVADMLGDGAEMGVAGVEFGPGVADADDGPALELVLREAAILEEGAVVEPHLVLTAEPGLAAQGLLGRHGHQVPSSWFCRAGMIRP
jgi:hypothetical protein